MQLPDNPTNDELFALINEHAEILRYLLQFQISRLPESAPTSIYLLRVAKGHVHEALGFAKSGMGIQLSPEQLAEISRNPDYILAQRATAPASTGA